MSKTFRVGEHAICISEGRFKGWEVVIQEPLKLCQDPEGNMWFGYPTNRTAPDGLQLSPAPHNLRRKDDDEGPRVEEKVDIGSWDKVGWNPHKKTEGTPA